MKKMIGLAGVLAAVLGWGVWNGPRAQDLPFTVTPIERFSEPWALEFLPDGRLLVTEKQGRLQLYSAETGKQEITGVPEVAYGGQGGLGDILLHPEFARNSLVYLSYAEAGGAGAGAAVARARLVLEEDGPHLEDLEVIWRQVPKVSGQGHYGHRLAFGPDGFLWVSSGERQKFDPAQDISSNLGKILRLEEDGSVPQDNPFADQGEVAAQVWSLGHRNPLGLAFDARGQLWNVEMGPRGGDELNFVERGANYGWPRVSNGNHYDGENIPDHAPGDGFHAPAVFWDPVISPSSLMFYSGDEFPAWRGDAFIGGLSSQALVRVVFEDGGAREAERFDMGSRIRAVEQGADGAIYLLEDQRAGLGGRLLRLSREEGDRRQ